MINNPCPLIEGYSSNLLLTLVSFTPAFCMTIMSMISVLSLYLVTVVARFTIFRKDPFEKMHYDVIPDKDFVSVGNHVMPNS